MNQLTIKPTNGAATAPDPLAGLPGWLAFLAGAYPAAKVNMRTYAVYDAAFADVDGEIMLRVVKAAVRKHKFQSWPTVAELAVILDGLQAESEAPVIVLADLHRQRAALLEAAYGGEIDAAGFGKLAKLYRLAGLSFAADYLDGKLARFEESVS